MTKKNDMTPKENPEGFLAVLALIGAIIGLGKLLADDTPFSWRVALGRAVVSGGLGASAGILLTAFPDASPVLLYGTAAALASLGTSALEIAFTKHFKQKE